MMIEMAAKGKSDAPKKKKVPIFGRSAKNFLALLCLSCFMSHTYSPTQEDDYWQFF
jgi:hypothetical protein